MAERDTSAGSGTLSPTRRFDDVSVGDELPPLELAITPTLIISTAIASRDYQDVHHDRDLAQQRGSKDIFMNILTSNGLVGRYVTDWTGPEALIRRVAIRLGAPNHPYDTMRFTGTVTAKERRDGQGVVELSVTGANSLGNHVVGTVEVALPTEE
ncbi:MAG TPA: MaoC family dehydratase, partial [Acidimicrobiales bacterium]|nr:MaoC family dehydratase [Acidimicrobiales bacterium]